MGYCISQSDIHGLEPGEVEMELRRESVVFTGERDERIEIEYRSLVRLHQLVEYALRHGPEAKRDAP